MSDSLSLLTAALAGRYTIERELGRGGTAIVYLARDLRHDRHVALKVLNPELALAVRTERFLREIQLTAKLNHPHILTLIDSGEAAGQLFYVLPYVEGESLRDWLTREKQLPLEAAVQITRDVAEALDYAHGQGIVHRDIKPENILLHAGHAVVMDFGIARALTVAAGTVTESGVAVGTPSYMSPEQAGGMEINSRTDTYSLGCVLYEMLAGHPPFAGATAQEILARHAMDPVPAVRAARRGVPEGIEQALQKALAKEPADRFATATRFAEQLSSTGPARSGRKQFGYAAGFAVLLAAVGIVTYRGMPGPVAGEQSVAVLPFLNLAADSESQYFADGMTEDLIDALVKVPGLRVPARTSAFVFKDQTVDIRDVGRRLNVTHVLEGSVRHAGGKLRVTAQLINVASGYHLWSDQYERDLSSTADVFSVQDDISRAIVNVLRLQLAPAAAAASRHTPPLEAYERYSKGRFFVYQRSTSDALLRAVAEFQAAIDIDSAYAAAYSGLADADILLSGVMPERKPEAKAAALRAVQLDSNLAEAHVSLGQILYADDRDAAAAEREFHHALRLNPNYALAHSWYGQALGRWGRLDEGIRELREGQRLDPLAAILSGNLGYTLYSARRYDESIAELNKAIDLSPAGGVFYAYRAMDYCQKGEIDRALVDFDNALRTPLGLAMKGYCLGRAGRRGAAFEMLAQLKQQPRSGAYWQRLAFVYAGLTDREAAIGALEKAAAAGVVLVGLKTQPTWDGIRDDPRFQRLVLRMGL